MVDPKKEEFSKITYWVAENILFYISCVLAFILVMGMLLEFLKNNNNQDYKVILDYAKTSLTLFGFLLIGGIFEKDKQKEKIFKNLFYLSLMFLSSAIGFYTFYYSTFIKFGSDFVSGLISIIIIPLCAVIGFLGFGFGLFLLLMVLIGYIKKIN
jgi:hypothetical protein